MQIHLARNGQAIGAFDPDAIRNGLQNGTYQPTDLGWHEGAAGWLPLSQMPQFAPAAPPAASSPAPPPVISPPPQAPPAPTIFSTPPGSPPPPYQTSAPPPPAYQPAPAPYVPPGQYTPAGYQPSAPNVYTPQGNVPLPRRGARMAVWIVLGLLVLGGLGALGVHLYDEYQNRVYQDSISSMSSSSSSTDSTATDTGTPAPTVAVSTPAPTSASRTKWDPIPAGNGQSTVMVRRRDFDPSRTTHFKAFTVNYPNSWTCRTGSQTSGQNFLQLVRFAPGSTNDVLELVNFNDFHGNNNISAYEAMKQFGPSLMGQFFTQFSRSFPNLRKVSEGWVPFAVFTSYEMRSESRSNLETVYLRNVLTSYNQEVDGLSVTLRTSSRVSGITGAADVGAKGDLAVIANSFRFLYNEP